MKITRKSRPAQSSQLGIRDLASVRGGVIVDGPDSVVVDGPDTVVVDGPDTVKRRKL